MVQYVLPQKLRHHLHVKIAGYCVAAEQKHASHITICVVALLSWRLIFANFSCAEQLSQLMTKTVLQLTFYSICNRYSCLRKSTRNAADILPAQKYALVNL